MNANYIKAVETRASWFEWGFTHRAAARQGLKQGLSFGSDEVSAWYLEALTQGETFFMDGHFCRLVDHARLSAPDELAWDNSWLIRPAGWLYLAEPFPVPRLREHDNILPQSPSLQLTVGAIGWRPVPQGATLYSKVNGTTEIAPAGLTQFLCYLDNAAIKPGVAGYGQWSYFTLRPGQPVGPRQLEFEQARVLGEADGLYGDPGDLRHEIRWVYTAAHLMAQRLSIRVRHDTDRATRRRAEKSGAHVTPFLEVVTLRRLEAARKREQPAEAQEWNWQWEVRGHWRNQWYPKEQLHKPKFIEAYVKGPTDKPFKEHGAKLFVARR